MSSILKHPDNLLFLDFETTGLLHEECVFPIEVAGIVTDGNLNVLNTMDSRLINPPVCSIPGMGDYVRKMHEETGLLGRLAALEPGEQKIEEVEDFMIKSLIGDFFPAKVRDGYRGIVIGGNSVGGFDRPLLDRFFPRIAELCDYRVYDVSTLAQDMQRKDPEYFAAMPKKTSDHTALHDIQESLREARYYRAWRG